MATYTLRQKAGLLFNHFLHRLFSFGRQPAQRNYEGAVTGRLFTDWVTDSQSMDRNIEDSLKVLRARSRQVCENYDYGKKFMHLLETNVAGAAGIQLKSNPVNQSGGKKTVDTPAKDAIESAWQTWCKKKNCTADGKLSFADLQRLFIKTVARDGEILVRKISGFDNPFRFTLQLIEPDQLDEKLNDERRNIRMGVERDEWYRPTAYHILAKNPADYYGSAVSGQRYTRLPAEQIIHAFSIDRINQTRGIPWTKSAIRRLHMLNQYEFTELVSARAGAGKMGFYVSPDGIGAPYDDKDSKGNLIEEVKPGTIKQLPRGYDFKAFDVDHPNAGFGHFIKASLRGVGAGLNVSYTAISNDVKEGNFSSIRHAFNNDRDVWMLLQGWTVEHLCADVYNDWLDMALITGQVDLPPRKIDKWRQVIWQGRRWSYVNPAQDMAANEKAVNLSVKSRTRIAAEQGLDIEEIAAELAAEETLLGLKSTSKESTNADN